MPRKGLDGWGESRVQSVRLDSRARQALVALRETWACTDSEVMRRALVEAADREPKAADDGTIVTLDSRRPPFSLTKST